MAETKSEMVKKWKIAPFLYSGSKWVRIKKSTAFDLALNPETQDFDYIADESPTTELMKYKPSINQSLTMYKGEEDYEMIFDHFYNLHVGSDAKTKVLLVFFQEEDTDGSYKAWESDCVISVNDLNSVDSTLTFDVLFGGTVRKGKATVDESGTISFEEVK